MSKFYSVSHINHTAYKPDLKHNPRLLPNSRVPPDRARPHELREAEELAAAVDGEGHAVVHHRDAANADAANAAVTDGPGSGERDRRNQPRYRLHLLEPGRGSLGDFSIDLEDQVF